MECSLCDNQGWFLSNDADWNDEIQKCDTCNVFKSDKEAQNYKGYTPKDLYDENQILLETIANLQTQIENIGKV